jgi:hypothetical protein
MLGSKIGQSVRDRSSLAAPIGGWIFGASICGGLICLLGGDALVAWIGTDPVQVMNAIPSDECD